MMQKRERRVRPPFIPAAVADVQPELFLDVTTRERLLRAAAEMRLPLLDHAPVLERRANMAGEDVRIRIAGIDDVAHLRSECEYASIAHGFIREGIEADRAFDESGREDEWRREFRGLAIRGTLLGCKRLPKPMHRALRNLADKILHIVRLDAASREASGTIDVGVRHGPAGIRLERECFGHPVR